MTILAEWHKRTLLEAEPFAPLRAAVASLGEEDFPGLHALNRALVGRHITVQNGMPLHFVPQVYGKLPIEEMYEPRCYLKGEVQTRADNWHDMLNALVWLAFPKAKAAINARHYFALTDGRHEESAAGSQRGAVRDTGTLLDESGVIIPCADDELAGLLRDFQWKRLFWQRRAELHRSMGFFIFGHGLYEKMLKPYVGLTGQGLLLRVEPGFFDWPLAQRLAHLDESLADYLDNPQRCRSTRELHPVPLLGVPGWAAENEDETYYDNTAYFRPGRQSSAQRIPLNTAPSSVAG
ncbi:MAG: DUF3025 domain-containing protein [Gallionella sp.]|nr:DUF3025 domain-containing protein [Gallionella sp.]